MSVFVCVYVILYVYHVHLAHEYPAGPEMVRGVDIGKPWKTCPCPCLFRDVFKKWAIHAGNSVNLAVARSVSFHKPAVLGCLCAGISIETSFNTRNAVAVGLQVLRDTAVHLFQNAVNRSNKIRREIVA